MKKFTFIFILIASAITSAKAQHVPGETYAGGMVVEINGDGSAGTVATLYEVVRGIQWGCITTCTGATSLTDGKGNTELILAAGCTPVPPAAHLCDTLTLNGYTDWYLPAFGGVGSHRQLDAIWDQRLKFPDYSDKCYYFWSSTEYCYPELYTFCTYRIQLCDHDFDYGNRGDANAVRCVRDFDDNDPTSIAKNNTANDFNIYPTITKDVFNIKFPENSKTALTFELFDISGRELLSENIAVGNNDNTRKFDLSLFSTGLYLIKISATDGSFVKNFKVQKIK